MPTKTGADRVHRFLFLAAVLGLLAMAMPSLTQTMLTRVDQSSTPSAPRPAKASGREVVVPAAADGHFYARFEMNGRPVEGLVDTGASTVALNDSTARRLGILPGSLTYSQSVTTANGVVMAAPVTLERVKLGSIAVDSVEALILPDTALSGTLIGMSFLSKLKSYGVEQGALRLRR